MEPELFVTFQYTRITSEWLWNTQGLNTLHQIEIPINWMTKKGLKPNWLDHILLHNVAVSVSYSSCPTSMIMGMTLWVTPGVYHSHSRNTYIYSHNAKKNKMSINHPSLIQVLCINILHQWPPRMTIPSMNPNTSLALAERNRKEGASVMTVIICWWIGSHLVIDTQNHFRNASNASPMSVMSRNCHQRSPGP